MKTIFYRSFFFFPSIITTQDSFIVVLFLPSLYDNLKTSICFFLSLSKMKRKSNFEMNSDRVGRECSTGVYHLPPPPPYRRKSRVVRCNTRWCDREHRVRGCSSSSSSSTMMTIFWGEPKTAAAQHTPCSRRIIIILYNKTKRISPCWINIAKKIKIHSRRRFFSSRWWTRSLSIEGYVHTHTHTAIDFTCLRGPYPYTHILSYVRFFMASCVNSYTHTFTFRLAAHAVL